MYIWELCLYIVFVIIIIVLIISIITYKKKLEMPIWSTMFMGALIVTLLLLPFMIISFATTPFAETLNKILYDFFNYQF